MAARQGEADRRPIAAPSGTVGAISASDSTVISPICCYLVVSCTVAGNIAVRMLDGNVAVIAVATGPTYLNLQFDQVRTTSQTATATYVGFYNL